MFKGGVDYIRGICDIFINILFSCIIEFNRLIENQTWFYFFK